MFKNTRLLGIPIPFYLHFEEVNLRFYVRYHDKGELFFIKEIVPKLALTFVADQMYKENYQTMKMSHLWEHNSDHMNVEYGWGSATTKNRFRIKATSNPIDVSKNSESEFISEQYCDYN